MPAQFVTANQLKDLENEAIHLLADQVRDIDYRLKKLERTVEAERDQRRRTER